MPSTYRTAFDAFDAESKLKVEKKKKKKQKQKQNRKGSKRKDPTAKES